MDDFTDLQNDHFDHASWLTEQIGQMEQWIAEKTARPGTDPNEISELKNHLKWLQSELQKLSA